MCDIFAKPSLSCWFSDRMRAAILGLPMRWWTRNASPSAKRCSNEWTPPGVMSAAGGMSSGGIAFTQIWPARRLKVGIMAVAAGHACDSPTDNQLVQLLQQTYTASDPVHFSATTSAGGAIKPVFGGERGVFFLFCLWGSGRGSFRGLLGPRGE